jgi:hypothetical protein
VRLSHPFVQRPPALRRVQSSHPGRFPGATLTIGAGQTSVDQQLSAGGDCGAVTLTFAAAGFPAVTETLNVVGVPQVNSLSRSSFETCQTLEFDIVGACLGDSPARSQAALLTGTGEIAASTVAVTVPDQRLHVTFPSQPPGAYGVAVANCGRIGTAAARVTVTAPPPQILSFDIIPSTIDICEGPQPRLQWSAPSDRRLLLRPRRKQSNLSSRQA